jgi:NTP pyrophosphatase (non-canonical NTP hydrolase)
MYVDAIEYVRKNLSKEELLAQLAEECAELGKAALKLRRVYSGENPTPVKRSDAYRNLIEEIADVTLCIEVLGLNTGETLYNCGKLWEEKSARWKRRLQESLSESEARGAEG